MKSKPRRWLMMVAPVIVSVFSGSAAFGSLFDPSLADIQGLIDQTGPFHEGMQLSTIDAIHNSSTGIELDITWRVGQLEDVFAPTFGNPFARVSLGVYTNAEDGLLGRLLFPGSSGVRWRVRSDHDSYVQPFVQTAPNWTFYEPIPSGNMIAGNLEWQWSTIQFDNAQNYSGVLPNTVVHLDGNGQIRVNAIGLQFGGPIWLVPGQDVTGHVSIFDWHAEPEPGSATLVILGTVGLLGCARRRR